MLTRYIYRHLNVKNRNLNADEEVMYVCSNKYDLQLFLGFVTQTIKCDLISYFHKYIYNDLDFYEINIYYEFTSYNYDYLNSIFCHLRLDDVAHKKDYDGYICSRYYKLLIENGKPTHNKFYDFINNHAPLSNQKINNMIAFTNHLYPNEKIYMVTSPISSTDYDHYPIISNDDVDLDLFILCNAHRVILSRSMFALTSLFFSKPKQFAYLPSWGFFTVCGLNTLFDNNTNFKYIY
jgi:hypothetical protein